MQKSLIINDSQLNLPLPQSKLKTLSSFEEFSILINNKQNSHQDHGQTARSKFQNDSIMPWLLKYYECIPKRAPPSFLDSYQSTQSPAFYMFVIEEIGDISYKRSNSQSKVFLKLMINLYNTQEDSYKSRTIQSVAYELQQHLTKKKIRSTDQKELFYHEERFHVFFYTRFPKKYQLNIDCALYQSTTIDKKDLIGIETVVGNFSINVFKCSKAKQTQYMQSGNLENDSKNRGKVDAWITYTLNVSDSFKILQKLIPQDCLVSTQDEITGIASKHLPSNQFALASLQYTELQSLKVDIVDIQISNQLIQDANKIAEQIFQNFHYNHKITSARPKQFRLYCYFHNGWNLVQSQSIILKEKMQVQRKVKQNILVQLVKGGSDNLVKIVKFGSQDILNLPFVFFGEQAMMILQISIKMQVKGVPQSNMKQTAKSQDKRTQQIVEIFDIPICNTFHPMLSHCQPEQKHKKCLQNSPLKTFSIATNSVFPTQISFDNASKIQYFLHEANLDKMHYSQHILSQSRVAQKDKIQLQKERIIRQNKKIKKQYRKLKISLNQQIPLLDTTSFKQEIYKKQLQSIRQERRQKEQMIKFLKQRLEGLQSIKLRQQEKIEHHLGPGKMPAKKNLPNYKDAVYYKAKLQSVNEINQIFTLNLPEYSNTMDQLCPIQILKTQLQQCQYSYLFFVSMLSLIPLNNQIFLPRKFIITLRLFTQKAESQILKVNQNTGEIVTNAIDQEQPNQQAKSRVAMHTKGILKNTQKNIKEVSKIKFEDEHIKNKQQIENIIHIEVRPFTGKHKNEHCLKLIQYLYTGYMQAQIVDADRNMIYGRSYFPLRELIRRRRTQAQQVIDAIVYSSNDQKAKLKLSLRSFRKQPTREPEQSQIRQLPKQLSIQNVEARQLQRIKNYKASINSKQNQKNKAISKLIQASYSVKTIKLWVNRMVKQLVFIQIENNLNFIQDYKIVISDDDAQYLQDPQCEIEYFNSDFKSLSELAGSITQYNNIKTPNQQGIIQMRPNQKGYIALKYFSMRKVPQKNIQAIEKGSQEQPYKFYNHTHKITVSLVNAQTSIVGLLRHLEIIPLDDFNTFRSTVYRKRSSQVSFSIPLLRYDGQNRFKYFIDDQLANVQFHKESNILILNCLTPELNDVKHVCLSLYDQLLERVSRHVNLQVWGAEQVEVKGNLWNPVDTLIEIPINLMFKHNISQVTVVTEDDNVVSLRDKNPVGLRKDKPYSVARLQITADNIGTKHYAVNVLNAFEKTILNRYVIVVNTPIPSIRQYSTINLKSSDRFLQQPFMYSNPLAKKSLFRILSTNPQLIWPQNQQIQIEAKSEKKLIMKINGMQIKGGQKVIISFKNQRIIENFMIILNKS